MSVYTTVGREQLTAWLVPLGLGELIGFAGIAAGMQNSNYFVTTAQGRFVLTLFERIDTPALDFYLSLMAHLADQGLPCPQPLAAAQGQYRRPLAGKPAALLTCLPGAPVETPTLAQCRALGEMLADLHQAGTALANPLVNPCGAAWRQATGAALLPLLSPAEAELLADELAFQAAQDFSGLPRGIIHADLFRDNVLWDSDGRLSGVLDFYFAGEDCLLFDLAVAANDWCFNGATLGELIAGYQSKRRLSDAEKAAWPALQRAAALRFWLLRLEVRQRPRHGEVVTIKDPDHFADLLQRLRLAPIALPR
jgi:homoserine kinase type II